MTKEGKANSTRLQVILMHPLMLHSASHNNLRIPRIITNPAAQLMQPFDFSREEPADYSLVELKTLRALGADPARGGLSYRIEAERSEVVPERVLRWRKEKQLEKERMAGGEGSTVVQQAVVA